MCYAVLKLSHPGHSKGGFKNMAEVEDYIYSNLCQDCKDKTDAHIDPLNTKCGREWWVMSQEEYEEMLAEINDMPLSPA